MAVADEGLMQGADELAAREVQDLVEAVLQSDGLDHYHEAGTAGDKAVGEFAIVIDCWTARGDVVAPALSATVATWQLTAGAALLNYSGLRAENLDELLDNGDSWVPIVAETSLGSLRMVLVGAVRATHHEVITTSVVWLTLLASLSQVTGVDVKWMLDTFGDETTSEQESAPAERFVEMEALSDGTRHVLRTRVGQLPPGTTVTFRFSDPKGEKHGAEISVEYK